jgi:hypothetical protein
MQSAGPREPKVVASAPLPGALQGPDGENLPLRPGMLAEALVRGESRTVLEWLLDATLRGRNDSAGGAGEVRR